MSLFHRESEVVRQRREENAFSEIVEDILDDADVAKGSKNPLDDVPLIV